MDINFILKKLDYFRNLKDWSISELTSQSDLSSGTIYEWYNHKKQPTLEKLEAVCNALGITLFDLFAADKMENLTAYQIKLLDLCDKLNEKQRDGLLVIANILADKE